MDRAAFFAAARHAPFGAALHDGQVAGLTALLDAFDAHASADPRWRAYMLATTYHETARTMQPVAEWGQGRGHAYGVPTGPWHQAYFGRGDVQLTWAANYAHATRELRKYGVIGADLDLERDAALALRPDIAAAVLIFGMRDGWFTGRKLGDYFTASQTLWIAARRIINGLDCAEAIAGYARAFLDALKAAGAGA